MTPPFFLQQQTAAHQQQLLTEAEKARLGDEARAGVRGTLGMWLILRQRLGSALVRAGIRVRGQSKATVPEMRDLPVSPTALAEFASLRSPDAFSSAARRSH